jgi:hypothetical protein
VVPRARLDYGDDDADFGDEEDSPEDIAARERRNKSFERSLDLDDDDDDPAPKKKKK